MVDIDSYSQTFVRGSVSLLLRMFLFFQDPDCVISLLGSLSLPFLVPGGKHFLNTLKTPSPASFIGQCAPYIVLMTPVFLLVVPLSCTLTWNVLVTQDVGDFILSPPSPSLMINGLASVP